MTAPGGSAGVPASRVVMAEIKTNLEINVRKGQMGFCAAKDTFYVE